MNEYYHSPPTEERGHCKQCYAAQAQHDTSCYWNVRLTPTSFYRVTNRYDLLQACVVRTEATLQQTGT